MRYLSVIFLAVAVTSCSKHSGAISIVNDSGQQITMICVMDGHSPVELGSLAPKSAVVFGKPAYKEFSLTYVIDGHKRDYSLPDTKIYSGDITLMIGTNCLIDL
jgi:hypothetical protein